MDPKADTVVDDSDDSLKSKTKALGFEVAQPANADTGSPAPRSADAVDPARKSEPLSRRDVAETMEPSSAGFDGTRDETQSKDDTTGQSCSVGAGTLDAEKAEAICRQFEDDLQQGKGPRIDDCIGDIDLPQRDALLSMLIAAELRFRVRAGERPNVAEYLSRFPENSALVDAVFLRTIAPERIGSFRVIRFLGVGNFGRVYLCKDEQLNRLVAIKVPRPDRLTGPEGVDRFLREARHAARVKHSGIVAVHRADSDEIFGCYVVMEYVEGGSLAALLKKKQLTRIAR